MLKKEQRMEDQQRAKAIGVVQNLWSLLTTSYACLSPSKPVPKAVQQRISRVLGIRIKLSKMPNNTIFFCWLVFYFYICLHFLPYFLCLGALA